MATGTVWRLSEPKAFARLRTTRFRWRSGPLWMAWVPPTGPDADRPPRVAFAIGKRVGGAVVRNRLRRRLRAALSSTAAPLPAGDYLLGASPEAAALTFGELNVLVRELLASLPSTAPAAAGAPR